MWQLYKLACLPHWWLCSWWAGAATASAIRWRQIAVPPNAPRLRTPLLTRHVKHLVLVRSRTEPLPAPEVQRAWLK